MDDLANEYIYFWYKMNSASEELASIVPNYHNSIKVLFLKCTANTIQYACTDFWLWNVYVGQLLNGFYYVVFIYSNSSWLIMKLYFEGTYIYS